MKHLEKKDIEAILWAIASSFFVTIMATIVRKMSAEFHTTQLLMMRCFFSLILLVPIIIKTNGKIFYTKKINLHSLRSISGFIAMLSWFYAITKIPLPEAVSITFIVPILTTLAAMIILKEKITRRLWLALLLGFIGMLTILRPGFHEITTVHFIAILSAVLWAVSNIITKKLTKTDEPRTVVLYLALMIFIMTIPASAPHLKSMNFTQLIWFFFLGLSANLAHISLSIAYGKTDLSTLQPFDFFRLIFISIVAYFIFGELVDIYMITGSIIIISASFYLSLGKKMQKILK